jgi:hypothetical protein
MTNKFIGGLQGIFLVGDFFLRLFFCQVFSDPSEKLVLKNIKHDFGYNLWGSSQLS